MIAPIRVPVATQRRRQIMPALILRYAGTKLFAGLYSAETDDELFDLIDEETDPGDYQYAVLPRGYGIEFRKGDRTIKYKIGKGPDALDAALSTTDGIYMTENLGLALSSGTGLKWRKLYED